MKKCCLVVCLLSLSWIFTPKFVEAELPKRFLSRFLKRSHEKDGLWMFIGYLKKNQLENDIKNLSGVYFRDNCVIVKMGTWIVRGSYAPRDPSTKIVKGRLLPLRLINFKTVMNFPQSELGQQDRLVKALEQGIGFYSLSNDKKTLILEILDGQRLAFVKPTDNSLDILSTIECEKPKF